LTFRPRLLVGNVLLQSFSWGIFGNIDVNVTLYNYFGVCKRFGIPVITIFCDKRYPDLMMAKFKAHSDEALLGLLRHKELNAFEEIYSRYWKRLYSMCYKRVQSREISEELVQDIFTSLWMNRGTTSIENLSSYLFTAIKYKVINHLEKEMSRKTYSQDRLNSKVCEDNSTEETVLLDDLEVALEREIGKLPAKRQMIYKLHRVENLSLKQVASQLGISEKTVENQFGKALKMLKVNLKHFTFIISLLACL